MHIIFRSNTTGPIMLVAEAEIHFNHEDGVLNGLKLVGFSLWRGQGGEYTVTVPARRVGAGADSKFFDLLRAGDGGAEAFRRFKAAVVERYLTDTGAATHSAPSRNLRG